MVSLSDVTALLSQGGVLGHRPVHFTFTWCNFSPVSVYGTRLTTAVHLVSCHVFVINLFFSTGYPVGVSLIQFFRLYLPTYFHVCACDFCLISHLLPEFHSQWLLALFVQSQCDICIQAQCRWHVSMFFFRLHAVTLYVCGASP